MNELRYSPQAMLPPFMVLVVVVVSSMPCDASHASPLMRPNPCATSHATHLIVPCRISLGPWTTPARCAQSLGCGRVRMGAV